MKKASAAIVITLALTLSAFAKSPNHDDFPMTFRVLSVDRQQEAYAGSTYWVYQYHIAVGTQGYTIKFLPRKPHTTVDALWVHSEVTLSKQASPYFARLTDHNHVFEVIVVTDSGKEVTEKFSIIGVD